jgi:site-specific DNA-methyltransferase (adenine-specific)
MFDSIVTDPPYGLSFMGKDWDHSVPGIPFWEEFLRVSKPGAHLLAFGGTRTHHRLMVAIEDAGWEIRDTLGWLYGSGFPKSLDVSKAIDKAEGAIRTEGMREWKGGLRHSNSMGGGSGQENGTTTLIKFDTPATDSAKQWSGWGTALKPAWEPIILARKPLEGTVAENVQKWGTGALNIDRCRVALEENSRLQKGGSYSGNRTGSNTKSLFNAGNGNIEYVDPPGRFPANLIHDGSEEVLSSFPQAPGQQAALTGNEPTVNGFSGDVKFGGMKKRVAFMEPRKDSGSAARFFYCAKASKSERNLGCENLPLKSAGECTDRKEGTDGLNSPRAGAGRTSGSHNHHPTVKPLSLLQYLCRLITPPDGLVLDPFAGSGTTGIAAEREGFICVMIELDADNYEICKRAKVKL